MPIIVVEQRERLWQEYNLAKYKVPRCLWGAWWYFWHRITRWWKLRPGLAVLQILYIISGALLGWIAFSDAIGKAPDPNRWHKPTALAAAVIIGLYKSKSSDAGKPHEVERRQAVRSLLGRINQTDAIDHQRLGNQHEARLKEVCECICRDIQEFLQIAESDVSVLVLEYISEGVEGDGTLVEVARDRPSPGGFFAGVSRRAFETFAFEAIRRRRMAAYHDLQSPLMREVYGEIHADYRAVFCLPLVRPNSADPFGILSVQFKNPYLLWPKADDKLDRRLSLYVEMLMIFLPRR